MKQAHLKVTFANPFECYEAIGLWLTEEAPEPWEEIAVEFTIIELDDVSNEMIDYKPSKGIFKKRKQFFVDDTGFARCFFELAKLTSTQEKGLYKKCHFKLSKNGSYKVSFEY